MTAVLVKSLSLVAIVLIAVGFKRLGWLKAEHFHILTIIVLRITLPAALITSFNTIAITASLAWLIVIGFGINLIQQGFAWVTARRRSAIDRSDSLLLSGSYNIGAFAMPYTAQLAGPGAVVPTAMFDIGNSLAVGGLGYGTAMAIAGQRTVSVWRFVLTMFKSPVFDVYLVLLILRLLNISFPAPIITFTSLVGAANPFCAMLMIGLGLELAVPKHTWARAGAYLARRYAFVVAFCLLIWYALPEPLFSHDIKVILVMVLWAPVAAMVAGFTGETGGNVQVASLVTSISIIVAIVMMPVVYLLAA